MGTDEGGVKGCLEDLGEDGSKDGKEFAWLLWPMSDRERKERESSILPACSFFDERLAPFFLFQGGRYLS